MMNRQLVNWALLLCFQFCYLEWPPANHVFIFQGEYEIFTNSRNWLSNFTHPLILLGLAAQLALVYCAVKKQAYRRLNHLAVILLGLVVLLFLVVGVLGFNYKIILSTVPFLFFAACYFIKKGRPITKAARNKIN